MKILEELYYGNISPSEKAIKLGSEYETLLSSLCKNDEVFKENTIEGNHYFCGVLFPDIEDIS